MKINPHTGEELSHKAVLTKVSAKVAMSAAAMPVTYSVHEHRDGTKTVTGYFASEAQADAWKREYDPPKPRTQEVKPEKSDSDA